MWLIEIKSMKLVLFQGEPPPYAILSHTWGQHELSFQDFERGWSNAESTEKIKHTCEQTLADRLDYVWIDTCCIDKSSSAELSEAINSMYRWYQKAQVCYVYLVDVKKEHFAQQFPGSCWFTRGWTLQELIAPQSVIFYDSKWIPLGSKKDLIEDLVQITGIDKGSLQGEDLEKASVAQRMSWAAKRKTTRIEDIAYSLLGIFGVNMPMLYGEGEKAFLRLQEEIMKISDDQSLFSWGVSRPLQEILSDRIIVKTTLMPSQVVVLQDSWEVDLVDQPNSTEVRQLDRSSPKLHGMLACSPDYFEQCGSIIPISNWLDHACEPPVLFARYLRLSLPIIESGSGRFSNCIAILGCYDNSTDLVIGIVFKRQGRGMAGRLVAPIGIRLRNTVLQDHWLLMSLLRRISLKDHTVQLPVGVRVIIDDSSIGSAGYSLYKFKCSHGGQQCFCSSKRLEHEPQTEGRRAVLVYKSPFLPPFYILLGKYSTNSTHSTYPTCHAETNEPRIFSRTMLRAGFFKPEDDIEEKLQKVLQEPRIQLYTHIWTGNDNPSKDANYILNLDDAGAGTTVLNNWHRSTEVLDRPANPCIRLSASLQRSSFPETEDCGVEEKLTIRINQTKDELLN
jgi:Heterokaryon incompatibility protein (HET)